MIALLLVKNASFFLLHERKQEDLFHFPFTQTLLKNVNILLNEFIESTGMMHYSQSGCIIKIKGRIVL